MAASLPPTICHDLISVPISEIPFNRLVKCHSLHPVSLALAYLMNPLLLLPTLPLRIRHIWGAS